MIDRTNDFKLRVVVIQDGARLHYSIPGGLEEEGVLERMYTDWYIPKGTIRSSVFRSLGWFSRKFQKKISSRTSSLIKSEHVYTNPLLTLKLLMARRSFSSPERFWEWSSQKVGKWVLRSGWSQGNAVFGFVRNIDPMLCGAASDQGLTVVVDQMIAPSAVERNQYTRERERWPGWEPVSCVPDFERVEAIERATWAEVDHLTCGSDYVRNGLISQGVSADRVTTIPYPVMKHGPRQHRHSECEMKKKSVLTVGFVGSVGLRKGSPYFLSLARRFAKKSVRFVMIGPVFLSTSSYNDLASVVDVIGPVPRSEIATWLDQFDVFLFPSTCEGSAGAVSEAMAAGLPVLVSPESGSVVRDGIDGCIIPYDDIEVMSDRLDRLLSDPNLRSRLGQAAANRSADLDSLTYAKALVAIYDKCQ